MDVRYRRLCAKKNSQKSQSVRGNVLGGIILRPTTRRQFTRRGASTRLRNVTLTVLGTIIAGRRAIVVFRILPELERALARQWEGAPSRVILLSLLLRDPVDAFVSDPSFLNV